MPKPGVSTLVLAILEALKVACLRSSLLTTRHICGLPTESVDERWLVVEAHIEPSAYHQNRLLQHPVPRSSFWIGQHGLRQWLVYH